MSATIVNHIRRGFYLDSVALMRISAQIAAMHDVEEAALMIGSDSNKQILHAAGLLADAGRDAGANDLIIGIRGADAEAAEAALAAAIETLDGSGGGAATEAAHWKPKSLDAAISLLGTASLALISVPGEFAAREARKALRRDLNVMMFSDNVSIEDECALKQEAQRRGLLLMGPDCGTAIINGVPLAFANAAARGHIGVIAASGTGLQEFSVLVTRAGHGISHGIGVGGRDLSDAVAAISTLTAIDLLEQDAATTHIVLISKPPGQQTAQRVIERLRACGKPATICFIGYQAAENALPDGIGFAATLRQAAERATGGPVGADIAVEIASLTPGRRYLRGLFCGGTMCAEAQVILRGAGVDFASNVPIPGATRLTGSNGDAGGHCLIDLGADEYTVGRPHPMIEPAIRSEVLATTLARDDVAVILLDVVLGYGAHADPAAAPAATLLAHRAEKPVVIASVCGVEGDPQDYHAQLQKLKSAGVVVAPSNAHAAELALRIIEARS